MLTPRQWRRPPPLLLLLVPLFAAADVQAKPPSQLQSQDLQAQELQHQELQLQSQQSPPPQLQTQAQQPQSDPQLLQPQPEQAAFPGNLDGEKFRYSYSVQDPSSGGLSGHLETRNGGVSSGGYFVQMPGAAHQTVNYFTDDWGYHPVVAYSTASGGAVTSTHFALGSRAVAALQQQQQQQQHKVHHMRALKHRPMKKEHVPATVLVAPAVPLPPPPATLVAPAAPTSVPATPSSNTLLLNSAVPDIGENTLSSYAPAGGSQIISSTSPKPESTTTTTSPGASVISETEGNLIDDSISPGIVNTIRPIIVAETDQTTDVEANIGTTASSSPSFTTPSSLSSLTSLGADATTSPTVVITPRPPPTSPTPYTSATEAILAPLGAASSLAYVSAVPEQHLETSAHKGDDDIPRSHPNATSKPIEKMTEMVIEKSPAVFEAHYHTTVEILKSIPIDAETGKIQTFVEQQERHTSQDFDRHVQHVEQVQSIADRSQQLEDQAKAQAELQKHLERQIEEQRAQVDTLRQEISQGDHMEDHVEVSENQQVTADNSQTALQSEHIGALDDTELWQYGKAQLPRQYFEESQIFGRNKYKIFMNAPVFGLKIRPVSERLPRPQGYHSQVMFRQLLPKLQTNNMHQNTAIHLLLPQESSLKNFQHEIIDDQELHQQLIEAVRLQQQTEDEQIKRNQNYFSNHQAGRDQLLEKPSDSSINGQSEHETQMETLPQGNQGTLGQRIENEQGQFKDYYSGELFLQQQFATPAVSDQPNHEKVAQQQLQADRTQPQGLQDQFQLSLSTAQLQQLPSTLQIQHEPPLMQELIAGHVGQQGELDRGLFEEQPTKANHPQLQQSEIQQYREPQIQNGHDKVKESQAQQAVIEVEHFQRQQGQLPQQQPEQLPRHVFSGPSMQEHIEVAPLLRQIEAVLQHQAEQKDRQSELQNVLVNQGDIGKEHKGEHATQDSGKTEVEPHESELAEKISQLNADGGNRTIDEQPLQDQIGHDQQQNFQQRRPAHQLVPGEELEQPQRFDPQLQEANSDHVVQIQRQISDEKTHQQAQISALQLQHLPAGAEQLQILNEEQLNAQHLTNLQDEQHHASVALGENNHLQAPSSLLQLNVEVETPVPFPHSHPVAPHLPVVSIDVNRPAQRYPPPRIASPPQRHRETDLSHKAVPGIDFDQVHCAERIYSYGPNGRLWDKGSRRANLRKLCIEYGGFKPPLVPSIPIEEGGQAGTSPPSSPAASLSIHKAE